ncbi:MAG: efflux transporter outer membrane subunit [Methylococcaceae bacterium]
MKTALSLSLLSSLLISCAAVGPDYKAPQMPMPKQWSQQTDTSKNAPELDKWWLGFNDALLNSLMTEAIAANLDLKVALLRVKDARILRSQTIAAGLPSLSAKTALSKRLNNTSQTGGGTSSGGGFGIGNQLINIFQLGFDAQWELDFFGGIRRAVEAADASVDSEVENSRMVLVTLLSEVARNLIELRANQQLIKLTQDTLITQTDTLKLTEIKQQSGLASSLEVAQAQAQLASTQATVPQYENAIEQAVHALGVLLGKEPNALAARLLNASSLETLPASLTINELPSDLLKRRPDIRKAERQLAVANAYVGIATADLYPKVNLAAFIGLQNMKMTDFTPVGKSWSSSATVTMPLFNWGKLNAALKSKQTQNQEALLSYQATVLTAFQEVEDALVAYRKETQHTKALNQVSDANQLTLQLASERYNKGMTDFIEVLIAKDALYNAQAAIISSHNKQAHNLIALYKALGGGWQTETSVANTTEQSSLTQKLFKP